MDEGEKSKSSTHCHCPQWSPSEDLIAEVSHCKPYQRFKAEEKEKQEKTKAQMISFSEAREKDMEIQKMDMKKWKKAEKAEKVAAKRRKLSFIL